MRDVVIGIDLGGTKIMAAAVNSEGRILSRVFELTPADKGPVAVLDAMAFTAAVAAEKAGLAMSDVAAVGIGSPGPLDQDSGVVIFTPNLPGWTNVPVKQHIHKATGRPVFIDNDCNVATLAEHSLGAGQGVADMIGLFLGTGIGGGVILDHRLVRGFSKQAGELGHVVVDVNGPKCGCGQRGCIEALASRAAICRQIAEEVKKGRRSVVRETDPRLMRTSILAEALAANDDLVMEVMSRAMDNLGVAVASIAHVVSPEMVVIGGGIIEAMTDDMLARVQQSAKRRALPLVMDNVKFVRGKLGEDAGVLGAAVLAQTEVARK